jgi:hypothetical protein
MIDATSLEMEAPSQLIWILLTPKVSFMKLPLLERYLLVSGKIISRIIRTPSGGKC